MYKIIYNNITHHTSTIHSDKTSITYPPAQPDTNTLIPITPQPSTPIKHAGSKHQTGIPTLKHITPQPSTPIKHAGSDCLMEEE